MVVSLLATPKDTPREGRYHITNLTHYGSLAASVNFLRDIENCEYVLLGEPTKVFEEMYRIGQRQFSWQRGFNSEQLYRYAYVYGQGECGKFFEKITGISVQDFIMFSFLLFSVMLSSSWTDPPNVNTAGLSHDVFLKTINIHSIDIEMARRRQADMIIGAARLRGGRTKTAYLPSVLRYNPVIKANNEGGRIIAPLPELIMIRATSGLYYDIARGPTQLLGEANSRFEHYVRALVEAYCPNFKTLPASKYGPRKSAVDTPDCLIKNGNEIVAVIECKATKLSAQTQYAENPMEAGKNGFEQLAKGITQVWRFFAHARQGRYIEHPISPTAHGVVLTMDGWMQMAEKLRPATMKRASELAQNYTEIADDDMRPVIFASVQELNDCLCETDEEAFLSVLGLAVSEEYFGHGLPEVTRASGLGLRERRPFPLNLGDLLPWMTELERRFDMQNLTEGKRLLLNSKAERGELD